MVERNLAKVEVASSRLVSRSKEHENKAPHGALFPDRDWRGSKAVMQRIANPPRWVRLPPAPPPPAIQDKGPEVRGLFSLASLAGLRAYFETGIANSAPLPIDAGQRCITLFCLV